MHNCGAGEDEVFIDGVKGEGGDGDRLMDLLVSIVCSKNYEEPCPRGSAANFSSGVELEIKVTLEIKEKGGLEVRREVEVLDTTISHWKGGRKSLRQP